MGGFSKEKLLTRVADVTGITEMRPGMLWLKAALKIAKGLLGRGPRLEALDARARARGTGKR